MAGQETHKTQPVVAGQETHKAQPVVAGQEIQQLCWSTKPLTITVYTVIVRGLVALDLKQTSSPFACLKFYIIKKIEKKNNLI